LNYNTQSLSKVRIVTTGLLSYLCFRFDDRSGWRSSAGHICRINDADYRLLSPTPVRSSDYAL